MNRHRRRVWELGTGLGFLLTIVLTLVMGWRQTVAAQVRADTIRLHVLANSDTIEDQLLKLQVRDAILAALPATVTGATTPRRRSRPCNAHCPRCGPRPTVRCWMPIAARQPRCGWRPLPSAPGTTAILSCPAAITPLCGWKLGAAQGHNWFCVLYPALCVSGGHGGISDPGGKCPGVRSI